MVLRRALSGAWAALTGGHRARTRSASGGGAVLPANLAVVPPGPDVPAALAAYSGVWIGRWNGAAARIAVERVSPDGRALVVHAHEATPVLGPGGPRVARARFRAGALRLSARPDGPAIVLRLSGADAMTAEADADGALARGAFRREGAASGRPRMAAAAGLGYGPAR